MTYEIQLWNCDCNSHYPTGKLTKLLPQWFQELVADLQQVKNNIVRLACMNISGCIHNGKSADLPSLSTNKPLILCISVAYYILKAI